MIANNFNKTLAFYPYVYYRPLPKYSPQSNENPIKRKNASDIIFPQSPCTELRYLI